MATDKQTYFIKQSGVVDTYYYTINSHVEPQQHQKVVRHHSLQSHNNKNCSRMIRHRLTFAYVLQLLYR